MEPRLFLHLLSGALQGEPVAEANHIKAIEYTKEESWRRTGAVRQMLEPAVAGRYNLRWWQQFS